MVHKANFVSGGAWGTIALERQARSSPPLASWLMLPVVASHLRGAEEPRMDGHRTTLAMMSILSWTLDSEGHEHEALDLARRTLQSQQHFSETRIQTPCYPCGGWPLSLTQQVSIRRPRHCSARRVRFMLLGPEHPETLAAMEISGS